MSDDSNQKNDADSASERPARRRRTGVFQLRYLVIGVVALAAIGFGAQEVHLRLTHVYADDARIAADMITISSRAEGWITELAVDDGDRVRTGQMLAQIDDRGARLRVAALKAELAGIEAKRERLAAERDLTDKQTTTLYRTRVSDVRASQAARGALESDLALARKELERIDNLFKRGVVAQGQLDRAQAQVTRLQSALRRIDAESTAAQGGVEQAKVERTRLDVIDSELSMATQEVAQIQALLEQQQIDLEDRTIRSPIDGVVDRRFVAAGEYVNAGQRMLLIHDPSKIWIEANIKETSVGKLEPDMPVQITVDAFPNGRFTGTVSRIGRTTTSKFALLPTPNPSGNFTKITQRVPVRIDLTEPNERLSPGMMVEVNIDIRK